MIKTIATHNGRFHSDDIFAVGFLKMLHPGAEVIRSRDQAVLDPCDLVLDVGGVYDHAKLRYDHHQPERAGARTNGVFYSAFGLIWHHYGKDFCGDEELWKRVDEDFVASFDAYDNGQKTYAITTENAPVVELQDLFDNYLNPNADEKPTLEMYDVLFFESLPLAQKILTRVIDRTRASLNSERRFFEAWEKSPDKRYVVLDEFSTAGKGVERMPELLYYVYQSPNGNWHVQAIPAERGGYEPKKKLPEAWAGLKDEEFAVESEVADAVFCHNALHLCGARSKEGALELLKQALI
jgi:uncharacterized UPF0160 family protein